MHRKQKTVTWMIKTRALSSEVEIEGQRGRRVLGAKLKHEPGGKTAWLAICEAMESLFWKPKLAGTVLITGATDSKQLEAVDEAPGQNVSTEWLRVEVALGLGELVFWCCKVLDHILSFPNGRFRISYRIDSPFLEHLQCASLLVNAKLRSFCFCLFVCLFIWYRVFR